MSRSILFLFFDVGAFTSRAINKAPQVGYHLQRLTCENAFGVKSDSAEFKAALQYSFRIQISSSEAPKWKETKEIITIQYLLWCLLSRGLRMREDEDKKNLKTFIFKALEERRKKVSDEIKEKSQILDVVITWWQLDQVCCFQVIVSPSANDSREKFFDDNSLRCDTWFKSLSRKTLNRNKRNLLFFLFTFISLFNNHNYNYDVSWLSSNKSK